MDFEAVGVWSGYLERANDISDLLPRDTGARVREIAVICGRDQGYNRAYCAGVARYARDVGTWWLHILRPEHDVAEAIRSLAPDGIICEHDPARWPFLQERAAPLIVLGGGSTRSCGDFCCVDVDEASVGRTAVDHLLSRGALDIVVFHNPASHWSLERTRGACERAAEADAPARTVVVDHADPWAGVPAWFDSASARVGRTGVFAGNDAMARAFLRFCVRRGVRVPDDLMLLGADDDSLLCQSACPSLSSVQMPHERVGYHAAELLDRMIRGDAVQPGCTRFPAGAVTARGSTDRLAVDDADVADAVRFIRSHPKEPLTPADVLDRVPVSRRVLERRFRRLMGCSIGTEIRNAHIAEAMRLLRETDWSMPHVAAESGFSGAARFTKTFHDVTGRTPTQYRRLFRPA